MENLVATLSTLGSYVSDCGEDSPEVGSYTIACGKDNIALGKELHRTAPIIRETVHFELRHTTSFATLHGQAPQAS